MSFLSVIGLSALGAVSGYLLREFGWRGVPVFGAVVGVMLLRFVLPVLSQTSAAVRDLASATGLTEIGTTVLKVVGIGVLSSVTADVAGDLGEGGIARGVRAAGRLATLGAVLPYMLSLVRESIALVS